MELHYVYVRNTQPPLRHVPCERVAVADGFWLYRYIPRYGKFIDDGYAPDLNQLRLILTQRHGQFNEMLLLKGFEEAAKLFALTAYSRIIHLSPKETFCTRISGEVFDGELRRNGEVGFVKKWINGIEKPKTIQEALERLDEYAKNNDAWIIFKRYPSNAFAYLVYPSP